MTILEFPYYIENELVKKSSPDSVEASSLMQKAEGRLKFSIKIREINENTAPYIFEDIYECLREAAQSLMALKGFKPYSHEALVSFLKEFFYFSESEIDSLDRYRVLRNKTIYRGEKISADLCNEALAFLISFFPKIKKEYEKLIK